MEKQVWHIVSQPNHVFRPREPPSLERDRKAQGGHHWFITLEKHANFINKELTSCGNPIFEEKSSEQQRKIWIGNQKIERVCREKRVWNQRLEYEACQAQQGNRFRNWKT